jgi:hypothetical protein
MQTSFRVLRRGVAFHPCVILTAALMFVLDSTPSYAQNEQQFQWLSVFILHVKPDRVGEFESLAKQMTAASAKAGEPAAQIWQVEAGEGGVYHVVIPMASMASQDNPKPPLGPAQMALWEQRITNTLDSSRHFFARLISMSAPENAPPAKLTGLRTVTVASGKQDEFIAWTKNDLAPAMKKANVGATLSQGMLGDTPRHFYFAGGIANWAAFDKPDPLTTALGEQGAQALFDKLNGVVVNNEVTILMPRPDLMAPAQ